MLWMFALLPFGIQPAVMEQDVGLAQEQESSHISMQIVCRTETGDLLPDVPILIMSREEQITVLTNADGTARSTLRWQEGDICVRVVPIGPDKTAASIRTARERFAELSEEYWFDYSYRFVVDEGRQQCSGEIIARETVSLKVQLLNEAGNHAGPRNEAIVRIAGNGFLTGRPDAKGIVRMSIARGLKNEVFPRFYADGSFGEILQIPSDACMADMDLGTLRPPAVTRDAQLNVIVDWGTLQQDQLEYMDLIGGGVTLIPIDGKGVVYSYLTRSTKSGVRALARYNSMDHPMTASGTYYLVPGLFAATPTQRKVIELARRNPGVIDERIPHIVAKAGEVTSIHFDAARAAEIVFNIELSDNNEGHQEEQSGNGDGS